VTRGRGGIGLKCEEDSVHSIIERENENVKIVEVHNRQKNTNFESY